MNKMFYEYHFSFAKCVSTCFAVLCQIRSIRNSVSHFVMRTLVSSLIMPRIDYCISVLSGVPSSRTCRLQSVMNASARVLSSASRFSSMTPLLRDLEWLPITHRIHFRLAFLVFSCRLHRAPQYLSCEVSDVSSRACRPNLRSSNKGRVVQPRTRHPTLGGHSFPASAIRQWNSLPASLRWSITRAFLKSC